LSRTFGTPTNNKIFTYSCWLKLGAIPISRQGIFVATNSGGSTFFTLEVSASGVISIFDSNYSASVAALSTTQVFRDPTAWMHLVMAVDTTQATAGNRYKLYLNGAQITAFSSANYAAQNSTPYMNSAVSHSIGSYQPNAGSFYYDGYLAEINFVDGSALSPSSFAETESITGRWRPIAYTGSYGTNGFYLKLSDNSNNTAATLGKDSSGSNNWTPNNFIVTAGTTNDSLVDSPTIYGTDTGVGGEVRGNYAVLNQLQKSGATITSGNLDFSLATTYSQCMSNIAVSSGKWYCELTVNAPGYLVGIAQATQAFPAAWGLTETWYSATGNFHHNGTNIGTPGVTYTTGDVVGFALDLDSATTTLKGYKNGTLVGTIASGLTGSWYMGFAGCDGTASRTGSWNFGQRPFNTSAPSGYKALCSTNFPTPAIKKGSSAMDVVTYTGTGASLSNTSLSFSPDLVWLKSRSAATNHAIYDSVRGATKDMSPNTTAAETTEAQGLTSFDSAGFTIGTLAKINTASATYVAWAWDKSVTAGLDIVSYVGNGANRTISHSLGVIPKCMIIRDRTSAAYDWVYYNAGMNATPQNGYMALNSTIAYTALAGIWNNTAPTSSNFSVGTNAAVNASGDNYIAYLWADVEGFSKFGSFVGNGAADGAFVYCGFRPKYILLHNATNGTYLWQVYDGTRDTYNVVVKTLYPTTTAAEGADASLDFLSNGFKCRSTTYINDSGSTIVYSAFAEAPFKYARAR
jgi:hypothetical protein